MEQDKNINGQFVSTNAKNDFSSYGEWICTGPQVKNEDVLEGVFDIYANPVKNSTREKTNPNELKNEIEDMVVDCTPVDFSAEYGTIDIPPEDSKPDDEFVNLQKNAALAEKDACLSTDREERCGLDVTPSAPVEFYVGDEVPLPQPVAQPVERPVVKRPNPAEVRRDLAKIRHELCYLGAQALNLPSYSTEKDDEFIKSLENPVATSSEKDDVTSEKVDDITSEESGDITSEGTDTVTSEETGDITSEETGDITSEETGNITSEENGDITSEETGNITSEETGNITSEETGDITSEENDTVTSEEKGNVTSEEKGNVTSEETDVDVDIGEEREENPVFLTLPGKTEENSDEEQDSDIFSEEDEENEAFETFENESEKNASDPFSMGEIFQDSLFTFNEFESHELDLGTYDAFGDYTEIGDINFTGEIVEGHSNEIDTDIAPRIDVSGTLDEGFSHNSQYGAFYEMTMDNTHNIPLSYSMTENDNGFFKENGGEQSTEENVSSQEIPADQDVENKAHQPEIAQEPVTATETVTENVAESTETPTGVDGNETTPTEKVAETPEESVTEKAAEKTGEENVIHFTIHSPVQLNLKKKNEDIVKLDLDEFGVQRDYSVDKLLTSSALDYLSAPSEDDETFDLEIKEELKDVLNYMDGALENVNEEKVEEFAQSEYFQQYKKLFNDLDIS